MPSGLQRYVTILAVMLLLAAPFSCVKVRGPGIIPPQDDTGIGEWLIHSMGYRSVVTTSGGSTRQWSILTRFSPDEEGEGLTALEITVAVDGEPVPFTFEENEQLLESAVSPYLSPGIHEFFLSPSENATHHFPTLRVRFEAP